jgi:hypothetical protein
MFILEKERSKWELAGKPRFARSPPQRNGKPSTRDQSKAAWAEYYAGQPGGNPEQDVVIETTGVVRQ